MTTTNRTQDGLLAALMLALCVLLGACGTEKPSANDVRKGLQAEFERRQPTAVPDLGVTRYVATSLGIGVAIRETCSDDARKDDAWPERASVKVQQVGSGNCAGWLLVSDSMKQSWVRAEFLAEQLAR